MAEFRSEILRKLRKQLSSREAGRRRAPGNKGRRANVKNKKEWPYPIMQLLLFTKTMGGNSWIASAENWLRGLIVEYEKHLHWLSLELFARQYPAHWYGSCDVSVMRSCMRAINGTKIVPNSGFWCLLCYVIAFRLMMRVVISFYSNLRAVRKQQNQHFRPSTTKGT